MEYRYSLSEIVDWDINEDDGEFVFSTRDNVEDDWGPFDIHVFIDDLDWQPDDPEDPDDDPDSWYLDNYEIYKMEFYPEGEDEVTEEELMKKIGITEENLEYLKQTAEYELGNRMSAWIDHFGPHAKVDNN